MTDMVERTGSAALEPLSDSEIRGGIPSPVSDLFAGLRPSGRVAALIAEQYEAGRRAASENPRVPLVVQTGAGPVEVFRRDYDEFRPDAEEAAAAIEHQHTVIRRAALIGCLTAKRAECASGLSILFADQQAKELQAWLDDPAARTLLLVGKTGNGKTQAAYACAAQAARYGAMRLSRDGSPYRRAALVRGFEVEAYLAALRPDGSPDPAWRVRKRAYEADLLVADELGAEMDDIPSEFVRKEVASLLGARLERGGRTIFTTNASKDGIKEKLGSRFWSRLQENATVLTFTGPDRRVLTELSW